AQIAGDGAADDEVFSDRRRTGHQRFELAVAAEGEPGAQVRFFFVEAARDVAHGAADRVAAVQRALRAAQHFDALNVENVEHRRLRTGNVDVVDIEANAR